MQRCVDSAERKEQSRAQAAPHRTARVCAHLRRVYTEAPEVLARFPVKTVSLTVTVERCSMWMAPPSLAVLSEGAGQAHRPVGEPAASPLLLKMLLATVTTLSKT